MSSLPDRGRQPLIFILGLFALLCLVGALIAKGAGAMRVASDPTIPLQSNFYHYTFTRFEPVALFIEAAFLAGLALFLIARRPASNALTRLFTIHKVPLIVALGVLAATCAGRFEIHQNFDLCIDEYLSHFEAQILDRQHLVATLPVEWRSYQDAMKVAYVPYNEDQGCWASGFLPGFASLNYVFEKLRIDWALSPLLAALSILLVAQLAKRAYPEDGGIAAGMAVVMLACCPQFLAMAMTKFAWTAHLGGSLLWVWLVTHPNRKVFLLTPILGVFLIGLHQPQVHLLIELPFLVRLPVTRDWRATGWFVVCYAIGCGAWYKVMLILRPGSHGHGTDLGGFSFSILLSLVIATFHAVTFLAWCTPVLLPFALIMLATWKKHPALVHDCFFATALSFLFYLSFPHEQGHGWGYRYLEPALGLLALVAGGGAVALCREGWSPLVLRAITASAVFSVCVQMPYRAWEMKGLVRPLAQTSRYIQTRPGDFVVVQTSEFWYGCDLIRNDPWLLRRPLIFDGARLTPEQLVALEAKGKVTFVGAKEVERFGVIISDPAKKRPAP